MVGGKTANTVAKILTAISGTLLLYSLVTDTSRYMKRKGYPKLAKELVPSVQPWRS
jgi:hypothetical protein